ncbi:MAG TPA: Zn-dependent hydrolase [Solirubrobacterales bacterium]|nr:Zn-dependent hydrolase [Solirubrobacterales bacterium]
MNSAAGPAIDAERVIADLRELQKRTGDREGAQRVCWSDGWRRAREFLRELLDEIGLEPEIDEAGNAWTYLPGDAEPALGVGSHLDSVPNGGWLDGALGVMGGLGALRAWAGVEEKPPRTLALVDWADEEGARFGRSLFGSSAAAGTFDPAELADARDSDGLRAPGVLAENGVDLERVLDCRSRLERIGAYLELHIEQGPVLEAEGIRAAAVSGCVGVERLRFVIRGRVAHAGTTPMDARRDAGLAASASALRVEEIARAEGGVGTVGAMTFEPGIPTAVPGTASMLVDLRHRDADALARMLAATRDAVAGCAAERDCESAEEPVWRIEPIAFDAELVALAEDACERVTGSAFELPSGALHDAASMAPHVPTAMIFSPSIGGVSHAPEEDTSEPDLRTAIEAFGVLTNLRITTAS